MKCTIHRININENESAYKNYQESAQIFKAFCDKNELIILEMCLRYFG